MTGCLPRMVELSSLPWTLLLLLVWGTSPALSDWTMQCSSCECKWSGGKKLANCTGVNLTSIPETLHRDIQVLVLDRNSISRLGENVFYSRLPNLHKIYMRHCGLKSIHANAFTNLKILIEVDLSNNLIAKLERKTFQENSRLKILNLSYNPIRSLDAFQFPPLPHLKTIDLSFCSIDTIQINTFGNLGNSIESLRFAGNKLTSLQEEMFLSLTNLKSLELHRNPWRCDCHLKTFREWVVERGLYNYPTTCREPERLSDKMWDTIPSTEFACKPKIEVSQGRIYSQPGTNVTLGCYIKGNPVPEAKWVLRGRIVNNNTSPTGVGNQIYLIHELGGLERWFNLTVVNLQDEDADDYTCVAVNAGGVSEQNVSLTFDTPVIMTQQEDDPRTDEANLPLLIGAIVGGGVFSLVSVSLASYLCCRSRYSNSEPRMFPNHMDQGYSSPDQQHLIEPRSILKQRPDTRDQNQIAGAEDRDNGNNYSMQEVESLFSGRSSNHTLLSQASLSCGDFDKFPDLLNLPPASNNGSNLAQNQQQPLDPTSLITNSPAAVQEEPRCTCNPNPDTCTIPTAAILPPPPSFLGPAPPPQVKTVALSSHSSLPPGISLNYVTLPRHTNRPPGTMMDSQGKRTGIAPHGFSKGHVIVENLEIPPVPPPAQFDTCCSVGYTCGPPSTTITTHSTRSSSSQACPSVWVRSNCQTLPNPKHQQNKGKQGK